MNSDTDFKLWDDFLNHWPLSKVQTMTLEQYTNIGDKTTFTYWLEHILRPYGSIRGGSAEKFGIFKRQNSENIAKSHLTSDADYTWNPKYGSSAQQAFEKIRHLIIQVIINIERCDLYTIKEIDLAFTLKWKIAFQYQDRNNPVLVAIFNETAFLAYFNRPTSIIEASNLLKSQLTENNLMELSNAILQQWNEAKNINIWKISFGRDIFSDEEVAIFDKNNQIVIYADTLKGQNEKFKNEAKIGDFVYITRSNCIYALAKITSDCIQEKNSSLLIREYELIKKLPEPLEYKGISRGWTPNYRSTFHKVKAADLILFESNILSPYFDYSLDDLENQMTHTSEMITMSKNLIKPSLNQILYGPPGTGKTYHTINKALEIIGENIDDKNRDEIKKLFDEKVASGQILFTTFHQSLCYEDFIEGIKPILDDNDEQSQVRYKIEDGIFKQLVDKANIGNIEQTSSIDNAIEQFKQLCSEQKVELKTSTNKPFQVQYHGNTTFRIYPENTIHDNFNESNGYPVSISQVIEYIGTSDLKRAYNWSYVRAIGDYLKSEYHLNASPNTATAKQNFVLIIDEINRGNVSQIFGELITLIEDDKRLGNKEALKVTLPYSKVPFGVPNNLYIIGTMNTADRSVEALDTALRRRFSFTEMLPDPKLLDTALNIGNQTINLAQILSTINERIEVLLDRDHQIGHSYFINVKNELDLCDAFNNKIIPLLQEYFFNDYAKIGLVLGRGFIDVIDNNSTVKFAAFDDSPQYQEKVLYRLKHVDKMTIIESLNKMGIVQTND